MIVLDASVVLKWLLQEVDSPAALMYKTRRVSGRQTVAAPDLLLYEITNALRWKPGVAEDVLADAVGGLLHIGLHIVAPTATLLEEAARLSFATHLSVHDCVYLALANELGGHVVTADQRMARQAEPLASVRLLSAH